MVFLIDHVPVDIIDIGIRLLEFNFVLRVEMCLHEVISRLPVHRQHNITVSVVCLEGRQDR
jgi:hypothetical protein